MKRAGKTVAAPRGARKTTTKAGRRNMTVYLPPDAHAWLASKAAREGLDPGAVLERVLADAYRKAHVSPREVAKSAAMLAEREGTTKTTRKAPRDGRDVQEEMTPYVHSRDLTGMARGLAQVAYTVADLPPGDPSMPLANKIVAEADALADLCERLHARLAKAGDIVTVNLPPALLADLNARLQRHRMTPEQYFQTIALQTCGIHGGVDDDAMMHARRELRDSARAGGLAKYYAIEKRDKNLRLKAGPVFFR